MGAGVQELKHAARVQEWSVRVADCRSSGIGVKAWCKEHGIALKTYYNWERQIVKEIPHSIQSPRKMDVSSSFCLNCNSTTATSPSICLRISVYPQAM